MLNYLAALLHILKASSRRKSKSPLPAITASRGFRKTLSAVFYSAVKFLEMLGSTGTPGPLVEAMVIFFR